MKKFIALGFMLVCIFGLVACTSKTEKDISQNSIGNKGSKEEANEWGITLQVENITAKGLTIVCHQSNGENVSQLYTGSYYVVQKSEKDHWVDIEYLPSEYDIAWTSEAWIIQKENTTKWDVNWEWLYGELSVGEYRIGKEIMNFRGSGDFEKEIVYVNFIIK